MKQTRMYVRVDVQELEAWKAAAKMNGLLLSEWVRGQCNEALVSGFVATTAKNARNALDGLAAECGVPAAVVQEKVDKALSGLRITAGSGLCASCTHKKSRHGGFGGCCQEDNCLCVGFKGE